MKILKAITFETENTDTDILDNYNGRTGKFIKGFLANTKRNKNGWRLTLDSLKKYSSDFINHPGIRYFEGGEPDHTGGRSYRDNMRNQEDYRVVNIIDVSLDESTETLNYVGEILDEDFEKEWEAGNIVKTSPAVWPEETEVVGHMDDGREKLDVYKWRALHQAYIDKPAYGDDATTISTCDGDGAACKIRLSAKTQGKGLCANDNLAPLMEVPLIKKKLKNNYTACQLKSFHAELMGSTDSSNCVASKLKIVMQDNPEMDHDQSLAIAYAFCQKQGEEELKQDLDADTDMEYTII